MANSTNYSKSSTNSTNHSKPSLNSTNHSKPSLVSSNFSKPSLISTGYDSADSNLLGIHLDSSVVTLASSTVFLTGLTSGQSASTIRTVSTNWSVV